MKSRVYIGTYDSEEFYVDLDKKRLLDGGTFMGLRPNTEAELRESASDVSPEDIGMDLNNGLERYFDYEKFHEEMEDEWYERADVQGEYDVEGVTQYLGFGSGTDIDNHFKIHDIKTYKDFSNIYENIVITEDQFNKLFQILKIYNKNYHVGWELFMLWQENISMYPPHADEYVELPKENKKLTYEMIIAANV